MDLKEKKKDIFIIGLALFSMFFGAGNLIFPPLLGQKSGIAFIVGFIFFFIIDAGGSILTIMALVKKKKYSIEGITEIMGRIPSLIISIIIILCLGPILAVPRCAATTYEIAILPFFNNFNIYIFSFIFFLLVILLTIKSNKVLDIIGKYLTPILFISLLILIIIGIVKPIGNINGMDISYAIREGISNGYQTVDMLGAMIFATIIVDTAKKKGYKSTKNLSSILIKASYISSFLLFIIYFGLTYIGATTSNISSLTNLDQTTLFVKVINLLLGNAGTVFISIIVFIACISTAVGLSSAASVFFVNLFKKKISYEKMVIIICIISYIFSIFGVNKLASITNPILNIVYPGILVLVILILVDNTNNKYIYRITTYSAIIISILDVLNISFIKRLPLYNIGFVWFIPTLIIYIISLIIYKNMNKNIILK